MSMPRLHQSIASVLINQSPLHAWYKAFRQEQEEWDDSRNNGILCHKLLLGGKDIVIIDAKDWRTNLAKEARDAAITEGKIPVLMHKLAIAHKLKDKLLDQLSDRGIELIGQSELNVKWNVGSVQCEGTLDHWIISQATIIDLKFTKISASPDNIGRLMVSTGADIQAAAYRQAMEYTHPELAGRIDSLYVYVEMDEPNAITVVRPNGEMRKLGESKWARACTIWQDCLEKYGTETPWPGYSNGIVEVAPPPWAMAQDFDAWELMDRQESNAID